MTETTFDFTTAASDAQLERLAERLRERNFDVVLVDTASDAKAAVLARIPEGSEVHSGKSKTLEDVGVFQALMESGRYDFIRARLFKMDRETQAREMRKLGAAPDFMVGSVQAVTEAGQLVAASASGSQLGPYASGAGQLILVVGSQKVVPDLDAALTRIREHVQPYEDARLREQLGIGTQLARILILERDFRPGRTTVILVRDPVGV
jgi:anion-transporting  ArsA/GET3 family ATPase